MMKQFARKKYFVMRICIRYSTTHFLINRFNATAINQQSSQAAVRLKLLKEPKWFTWKWFDIFLAYACPNSHMDRHLMVYRGEKSKSGTKYPGLTYTSVRSIHAKGKLLADTSTSKGRNYFSQRSLICVIKIYRHGLDHVVLLGLFLWFYQPSVLKRCHLVSQLLEMHLKCSRLQTNLMILYSNWWCWEWDMTMMILKLVSNFDFPFHISDKI